ncbi:MAG: phosphonate metabolism protein/1,5-bisphosphokinase (PRPP-forming) PhnN [Phenylobacterium sp.]|uniref:phosphonate metabolism protein/1,5-bisphosphokinase (PRPP-forming) PhnN n=1 Tax=Phenylobacterium sp. TaxID=1871053 RepID=UPI0025ED6667|nr:phosphonate metabolism protein/1,5-bisphosphokinase (PRPP-forming) PhnN [Phenylobacterium sp.]MCG9916169.1 phosphonate metabolism protein/1,5-bisphosphokinase (PRPP-forming) PhnN [Phenylobacterium sp.]
MKNTPERGWLVLVVGPSGVGKDTLIDGARAALADNPQVVFLRREITRPAEAGGEDHQPISETEFQSRQAAGAYLLSWTAHGLCYGAPASALKDLTQGRTVVVNVSRGVIDEARRLYHPVRVIAVSADPDQLAERLRQRGRESAAEVVDRIAQAQAYDVTGDDVVALKNDGSREAGVMAMIRAIMIEP